MPTLDEALADFPKSELWRLQGVAFRGGPLQFSSNYYKGMNAGFKFINENPLQELTPAWIEALHRCVYQFEEDFRSEKLLQGYKEAYGAFELILSLPGLEHEASVSERGIDELMEDIKKSYDQKGNRFFPQHGLFIELVSEKWPINFKPNEYSAEDCRNQLLSHLTNASASKSHYTGPKTSKDQLTKVEMASYEASRAEILHWVQEDIEQYQEELKKAKTIEDKDQRRLAELKAIIHFIRKLKLSQYLPDDRSLVLLANMLLLQNGYGIKLTQHPAHYAGFSSEELLQETEADMALFNEFKITPAKDYLSHLEGSEINHNREGIKAQLAAHLSHDPLIAMAQLNELYVQIQSNTLTTPKHWKPDPGFFALFAKKTEPTLREAHFQIVELLKDLYISKLEALVDNKDNKLDEKGLGFGTTENGALILDSLLKTHIISEACDANRINQAIETYETSLQIRPS